MGKLETTPMSVNKGLMDRIAIQPHNGSDVAVKTMMPTCLLAAMAALSSVWKKQATA